MMPTGTFMVYGDLFVPTPDKDSILRRAWAIVEDAYSHAVWSEGWRTLTGKSWEQWRSDEAARRERWNPTRARLDVTLDPTTAMVSSAKTSAGVLPLTRFDTHTAVGDDPPTVTLVMPMHDVTIRTR